MGFLDDGDTVGVAGGLDHGAGGDAGAANVIFYLSPPHESSALHSEALIRSNKLNANNIVERNHT